LTKIGVVIPTRNRSKELQAALLCIINQDIQIEEVVVVDSSDNFDQLPTYSGSEIKVTHVHTPVRSAAEQRNIGKRMLNKSVDFLAFIDDDILVERDYVSRLMSVLFATEAVGVSGIATNREINKKRLKPFGLSGLIHRIFLLDSKTDGALLYSGINIPIRSERDENLEVDWLIGCSIWRSESIEDLEFERDFKGQSLAEDVIFSVRARKRGKLITNPSVVIDHYESPNERPDKLAHYQMWVENRKRLITVMGGGFIKHCAFQLANFGQALIFFYLGFREDKKNFRVTFKILNASIRNL